MKRIIVLSLSVSLLVSCQNTDIYSGDVYTADRAKQAQSISYGTIVAIRSVRIQTNANSDGASSTGLGSIGGAVIGGLLGHTVGGGKGNKLATGAGAVAGAVVGSKVQNDLSSVTGVELEIKRENGTTVAVVQKAPANKFYIGQSVKLISNGRDINVAPR